MAKRQGRDEKDDAGFLSRWSERKRGGAPDAAEPTLTEPAPSQEDDATAAASWSEEQIDSKLGEIDAMKPGDDFKPLLKAGVPEVVKRAALRKLWRSNPVFGILDGLNDYDLDYTIKPGLVEAVRSAYQAGKGYVYDEEKEAERQAEIAARHKRDKEREKERERARAEREDAAGRQASEAAEDGGFEGGAAAQVTDSGPAPEVAENGEESTPRKPRGSAAARRWGGDPA